MIVENAAKERMDMAAIAERLKQIMAERGLKQVDIIRLAEPIGALHGIRLGKSHISQYVSGKSEPRWDILKVLAEALEVDPLWLQGEEPPRAAGGAVPGRGVRERQKGFKNHNGKRHQNIFKIIQAGQCAVRCARPGR